MLSSLVEFAELGILMIFMDKCLKIFLKVSKSNFYLKNHLIHAPGAGGIFLMTLDLLYFDAHIRI